MENIKINYYSEPLERMPYAQARIEYTTDGIILISYTTRVAKIQTLDDGRHLLECSGLYSATTRKHISAFARQFGFDYYDFKDAFLNGGLYV